MQTAFDEMNAAGASGGVTRAHYESYARWLAAFGLWPLWMAGALALAGLAFAGRRRAAQ